jgi:hypothetical protein
MRLAPYQDQAPWIGHFTGLKYHRSGTLSDPNTHGLDTHTRLNPHGPYTPIRPKYHGHDTLSGTTFMGMTPNQTQILWACHLTKHDLQ